MSLQVSSLSKRYGPVRALDDVSIRFDPGEIHAVLGENGAGKSTLVGILSGFVVPDLGEVSLNGEPVRLGNAAECGRRGIRLIHQHFTLVPQFTGEENLALGNLDRLAARLKIDDLTAGARAVSADLGWDLPLKERVASYSVGQQQRLEILRAVSLGGEVFLFDEPTAVLAPDEVDDLLNVLRRLRDDGKIVVLIAHKLAEVLAVADRVTVLRKGRWVASAPREGLDAAQLVEWMVGEIPALLNAGVTTEDHVTVRARELTVLGSRGETAVRGASFEVRRGEILGVGGVDGNGQIELAEALAGVRPVQSGAIDFTPSDEQSRIAYIPQDRHRDGLAMGLSVGDNLLLGTPTQATESPFLNPRRIDEWARGLISRFEIDAPSPKTQVANLSGGNQQKVVVSRNLDSLPAALVAVNPTRGLDVKSTRYVHQKIRDAAAAGCAVVLISTDADELAAVSARRASMDRGSISFGDVRTDIIGGSSGI